MGFADFALCIVMGSQVPSSSVGDYINGGDIDSVPGRSQGD